MGMSLGEKAILTVPGSEAYGPGGIPGVIPPNATLIFEVELLSIGGSASAPALGSTGGGWGCSIQ